MAIVVSGAVSITAGVDASVLKRRLGLKSDYLASRLLAALGHGRPLPDVAALDAALAAVRDGSLEQKVELLFRLHDADGSGRIERDELERMIHIALAESKLLLEPEVADRLVEALFSTTDIDRDGRVDIAELLAVVQARPALRDQLAAYGQGLLAPRRRVERRVRGRRLAWTTSWLALSAFVAVWIAANVALFVRAWVHYGEAGAPLAIQIARGCGACLNLDGALVLVPMLRHGLTWVRRRPIGRVLPIDSAVDLHRWIGEAMLWLALVHTLAHVANLLLHAPPGTDWGTRANVTGVVLLWVFSILWIMSRRRVRSSGHFTAFHFAHRALWWVWFLLLLAHGPVFWMWAGVPLVAFLGELVFRTQRAGMPATIVEARALASGVTHLRFTRPPGFGEAPGDYVFVRVPAVSAHEWHPFTLTSAPESEHLSVHVRRLGDWTSALHERFLVGRDGAGLPIHVDGPYGTPAFHILQSEHAIAIAAGIGVTPFASVLASIRARAKSGDVRMRLRRLHFVWLSREQESFEWFSTLLSELERQDTSDLFDIHIFVTGARDDLEGTSLELARALLHEQTGEDLVTGLRARTRLGRPDITGLLDRFIAEPGLPRPDVYFCGPHALGRSLARDCTARGLSFRQERF